MNNAICEKLFPGYTNHLQDGALRLTQKIGDSVIEILVCPNSTDDGFTIEKVQAGYLFPKYEFLPGKKKYQWYIHSRKKEEFVFFREGKGIDPFRMEINQAEAWRNANSTKGKKTYYNPVTQTNKIIDLAKYTDEQYWDDDTIKLSGNSYENPQLMTSHTHEPQLILSFAQSLFKTLKQKSHRSKAT